MAVGRQYVHSSADVSLYNVSARTVSRIIDRKTFIDFMLGEAS